MLDFTKQLLNSKFRRDILTPNLISIMSNKRGKTLELLISRALKNEELIRLKRGMYMLHPKLDGTGDYDKFNIANQLIPFSYISLQSALSYHSLIPEAVYQTTSISLNTRSCKFTNYFNSFYYSHLPTNRYESLNGVLFVENALMASPLRAIADYVYKYKVEFQPFDFLVNNLRIEEESIIALDLSSLHLLLKTYRSKRVKHFLKLLHKEIEHYGKHHY